MALSGLAFAIVLELLAGTSCHVSRNRNIGLEWNNAFTWDDRFSPAKLAPTLLPPHEVETIKRAAMDVLRTAFPPETGVRFDTLTAGGIDMGLFYGPPLYWPAAALKDMHERFQ